jgi:hypothetical protein
LCQGVCLCGRAAHQRRWPSASPRYLGGLSHANSMVTVSALVPSKRAETFTRVVRRLRELERKRARGLAESRRRRLPGALSRPVAEGRSPGCDRQRAALERTRATIVAPTQRILLGTSLQRVKRFKDASAKLAIVSRLLNQWFTL